MERPTIPSPARLGLVHPSAESDLELLGWVDQDSIDVLWALSYAADPNLVLSVMVRLAQQMSNTEFAELDHAIRSNPTIRARLFGMMGASSALGNHLAARASRWHLAEEDIPSASSLLLVPVFLVL